MIGKRLSRSKAPKTQQICHYRHTRKTGELFLLFNTSVDFSLRNNFANSGSFAKVSVPVHIYNSLSSQTVVVLITMCHNSTQRSLTPLDQYILYITDNVYTAELATFKCTQLPIQIFVLPEIGIVSCQLYFYFDGYICRIKRQKFMIYIFICNMNQNDSGIPH